MHTILFDLDNTLLPLDQEAFTRSYFQELSQKLEPHGYDPAQTTNAVWHGFMAMVQNDGSQTNEQCFWDVFDSLFLERSRQCLPLLGDFYHHEFNRLREYASPTPLSARCVRLLKEKGYRIVVATNPVFPLAAQEARLRWAGLDCRDFDLITSYETSRYCKPNPRYYQEIVEHLACQPEDCLMVGNDVEEDMTAASAAGLPVYLLTDGLINRKQLPTEGFPQSDMAGLVEKVESWPHLGA